MNQRVIEAYVSTDHKTGWLIVAPPRRGDRWEQFEADGCWSKWHSLDRCGVASITRGKVVQLIGRGYSIDDARKAVETALGFVRPGVSVTELA